MSLSSRLLAQGFYRCLFVTHGNGYLLFDKSCQNSLSDSSKSLYPEQFFGSLGHVRLRFLQSTDFSFCLGCLFLNYLQLFNLSQGSRQLLFWVTEAAVSAVLVKEQEGVQHLVYYISKSLLPAETKYTSFEKLALALVTASYKLRPYFESHTIRALADFVSDFCPATRGEAEEGMLTIMGSQDSEIWTLYIDGASNARGAGVGLVLRSPKGDMIVQAIRCEFKATNNEAEYEALILGMQMASGLKQDQDWRVSYINWLRDRTLPKDRKEAQSFRIKASRYILIDNVLFRKSLDGPCLRCLNKEQAETVMQDVHGGECGNHAGGRSLSNKILRHGYFWPTMRMDAVNHAKRCESCQKAAPAIHQPAKPMHLIISPWPFMMWGMNIVGKVPKAPGNRVYMLVMTDYFSKWIEVEAMTEVKEWHVISFIKCNIISRFGIPSEIVCDNGSKFISDSTEGFCSRWNITLRISAPRYPQTNGQAESSNKIIVENLRKRLEELGGKWADELPLVLWSDRTTPKMATGQTPFNLVYGAEEVIPSEVLVPTHRYGCQTAEQNGVVQAICIKDI
ncbi:uncharacterized protein LOC141630282 [Silene latifolia]|uniref:uncharacterized protein LOC141630282 n=1 Tax=Silene latifolia TaxID=37657 RepID=UPI003D786253